MARWWLVEQQQIFATVGYLLTKVLLGTPTVSITNNFITNVYFESTTDLINFCLVFSRSNMKSDCFCSITITLSFVFKIGLWSVIFNLYCIEKRQIIIIMVLCQTGRPDVRVTSLGQHSSPHHQPLENQITPDDSFTSSWTPVIVKCWKQMSLSTL